MQNADVIIVGGGLAGLTAATILGRAGKRVLLLEKSSEVGGRARTTVEKGFRMNLGPHALYKGGEGFRILTELGIKFSGKSPSAAYSYTLQGKKLKRLPYALLNVDLLNFYRRINGIKTQTLENVPLDIWLSEEFQDQKARQIITMLVRIATYSNDETSLSAGAAIEQVRLAISKGVLYLDGGWQVLIEGLISAARISGVKIVSNCRVISVETTDTILGVRLADGKFLEAKDVILSVNPQEANRLIGKVFTPIHALVPVKMAALTLGLKRLPFKKRRALFDLDRPLYLSVHSAWADLTEQPNSALIHLGKYLRPNHDSNSEEDRAELESMMDICQPGWRSEVLTMNFLPSITVTNTLVTASMGGKQGRPAVEVPGVRGLYLSGDWVGNRGMLCDASVASAEAAAQKILRGMDAASRVA